MVLKKTYTDFVLRFSISGNFFSETQFLNLYTMMDVLMRLSTINKLSWIQIRLFPSVTDTDKHPFHEW